MKTLISLYSKRHPSTHTHTKNENQTHTPCSATLSQHSQRQLPSLQFQHEVASTMQHCHRYRWGQMQLMKRWRRAIMRLGSSWLGKLWLWRCLTSERRGKDREGKRSILIVSCMRHFPPKKASVVHLSVPSFVHKKPSFAKGRGFESFFLAKPLHDIIKQPQNLSPIAFSIAFQILS